MIDIEAPFDMSKMEALRGIGAGFVAFTAGVLCTVVLVSPDAEDDLFANTENLGYPTITYGDLESREIPPPGDVELGGWLYHQAHFASIDVSTDAPAAGDIAFAMDPSVPMLFLPILALTAAGFVLAWRGTATGVRESALNGTLVSLGYLPMAYLSTHVLYYRADSVVGSAAIEVRPETMTAVLLSGILYPVLFGAIGGAIYHWVGGATVDTASE